MRHWTALVFVLAAACEEGKKPPAPVPPRPVPEVPKAARAAGTPQKDAMIDADWDAKPAAGKGNIRLMVNAAGQPFHAEGPTRFNLQAKARRTTMCGFNPSTKGRFVLTDQDPGEYEVSVTDSKGEFKPWKKPSVKVDPGQVVTLDVELEK